MLVSNEQVNRVALRNINGIGSEILELGLGLLEVLEVDGDALAEVAGVDVVEAVIIVNVAAGLHDIAGILELVRVHHGVALGVVGAHFLI